MFLKQRLPQAVGPVEGEKVKNEDLVDLYQPLITKMSPSGRLLMPL